MNTKGAREIEEKKRSAWKKQKSYKTGGGGGGVYEYNGRKKGRLQIFPLLDSKR